MKDDVKRDRPLEGPEAVDAVKALAEALDFIRFCGSVNKARHWIEAAHQVGLAYKGGESK